MTGRRNAGGPEPQDLVLQTRGEKDMNVTIIGEPYRNYGEEGI